MQEKIKKKIIRNSALAIINKTYMQYGELKK